MKTIDLGKSYCLLENKKDSYGRNPKYQLGDNVGVSTNQELIGDNLALRIDWIFNGEYCYNWYDYEDLQEYVPTPYEDML